MEDTQLDKKKQCNLKKTMIVSKTHGIFLTTSCIIYGKWMTIPHNVLNILPVYRPKASIFHLYSSWAQLLSTASPAAVQSRCVYSKKNLLQYKPLWGGGGGGGGRETLDPRVMETCDLGIPIAGNNTSKVT